MANHRALGPKTDMASDSSTSNPEGPEEKQPRPEETQGREAQGATEKPSALGDPSPPNRADTEQAESGGSDSPAAKPSEAVSQPDRLTLNTDVRDSEGATTIGKSGDVHIAHIHYAGPAADLLKNFPGAREFLESREEGKKDHPEQAESQRQAELTPRISSTELATDRSEGRVARAVEPHLDRLCKTLKEQRLLIFSSPDARTAFDVACAVACDEAFANLNKRTFVPAPRYAEARRVVSERGNKDAQSQESSRLTPPGPEDSAASNKIIRRSEQVGYTLIDLAVNDQPELRDCVLLIEIASDSDVLLPSSPTALNQVSSGLKQNDRFLVIYVSGPEEQRIQRRLIELELTVEQIDFIPYLVARHCSLVKDWANAATCVWKKLKSSSMSVLPNYDCCDLLQRVLQSCSEATDKTFGDVFNAQIERRQSQRHDIDSFMRELEGNPDGRIIRTLLFVGSYFRDLEWTEFSSLVHTILERFDIAEKDDAARIPEPQIDKDGKVVPQKPLPTYVERWRRNQPSLLRSARLMVRANDGQKRVVAFEDPLFERDCRNYFEETFFETSEYFWKLRELDGMFAVSQKIFPQMAYFYVNMAVAEPAEFQRSCIPELIQYCMDAVDPYELDLATARMAHLVQTLSENSFCVELVSQIRHDLIEVYKDYEVAFGIAKHLSLISGFDSLSWFRALIEKAQGNTDQLIAGIIDHLELRLCRHPDGPYVTISEIIKWLPEKYDHKSLSALQKFATLFVIIQALYPWLYALKPFSGWLIIKFEQPLDYSSLLKAFANDRANKELIGNVLNIFLHSQGIIEGFATEDSLAITLIGWFFVINREKDNRTLGYDLSGAELKILDVLVALGKRDQRKRILDYLSQQCGWFYEVMNPNLSKEQSQRLRDLIATSRQLRKVLSTYWLSQRGQ